MHTVEGFTFVSFCKSNSSADLLPCKGKFKFSYALRSLRKPLRPLRLNIVWLFTAELGKVSRRERKEIQLSFILIVLNDRRTSGADLLPCLFRTIGFSDKKRFCSFSEPVGTGWRSLQQGQEKPGAMAPAFWSLGAEPCPLAAE
jgi:hypothetical protein